jgi:hypothetical protein
VDLVYQDARSVNVNVGAGKALAVNHRAVEIEAHLGAGVRKGVA